MKIRVISEFYDKFNTRTLYKVGTVLDFEDERANDIISKHLGEPYKEEKAPKVEAPKVETPAKEEIPAEKPESVEAPAAEPEKAEAEPEKVKGRPGRKPAVKDEK